MRIIPKSERLVLGDIRVIKRFLFLPRRIRGEIRWLEVAHIKQQVIKKYTWGLSKEKGWIDIGWAD
ncbi:hypothetical protein [Bacillus phage vB_BanS-Thrax5]|nr:hypothetical protein [Bacillus phage vB_BanS-Thrax5]